MNSLAHIIDVTSAEQLEGIFEQSNARPVAILKHSNSCGISYHILEQLRESDVTIHLITIQEHRPLSDAVAVRTGHRHQSPQAFVISRGDVVYHATHYGIDGDAITRTMEQTK